MVQKVITDDQIDTTLIVSTANLADAANVAQGDDLVGFKQSNTSGVIAGAVAKTLHDKMQEFVSVKDFGAVGDGVTDDTAALNTAFAYGVNNKVQIHIPSGTYVVTDTLWVTPEGSTFKSAHITGAGSGYGGSISIPQTVIDGSAITNKPVMNVQLGRGVTLKGFSIRGPLSSAISSTASELLDYDFNYAEGNRATRYSPQCGLAIDAGVGAIPADGGYSGFTYRGMSSGSHITVLDDIGIYNCVVGILIGPDANVNSSDMSIYNTNIGFCQDGLAVCHSQARGLHYYGGSIGGCRTAVNTAGFGIQQGQPPIIHGTQFGPGFQIFESSASFGTGTVTGCRSESVHRLGRITGSSTTATFSFYGCDFAFLNVDFGITTNHILEAETVPVLFSGCLLGYDSSSSANAPAGLWLTANPLTLDNCSTLVPNNDKPIIGDTYNLSFATIFKETVVSSLGDVIRRIDVSGRNATTLPPRVITSISSKNATVGHFENTYAYIRHKALGGLGYVQNAVARVAASYIFSATELTFELTTTGTNQYIQTGDHLYWKMLPVGTSPTGFWGPTLRVTSVVGTTVTCKLLSPRKYYDETHNPANIEIVYHPWAPGSFLSGDTTVSSATITNVSPTTIIKNGDWITGSNIPYATRVVSGEGTSTIVLSKTVYSTQTKMPLHLDRLYAINDDNQLSLKAFGAKGDGGTDDAVAIQSAIDVARAYIETIGQERSVTINVPDGLYAVNSPIKLYSGVTLKGQGPHTRIIQGGSFAGTALVLISGQNANTYCYRTGLEDIGFTCTGAVWGLKASAGIVANSSFRRLVFSSAFCMDFGTYTQACTIEDVWAGGYVDQILHLIGNHNIVRNIDKEENTGTTTDPYILVEDSVGGDCVGNVFDHILIEGGTSVNKPLMVFTDAVNTRLENIWLEPTTTNGYGIVFNNCDVVRIGSLTAGPVVALAKLDFNNTRNVVIEVLDIDSSEGKLSEFIEVDSTSSVVIDHLRARRQSDIYSLDTAKNLIVKTFSNRTIFTDLGTYPQEHPISQPIMLAGQNLAINGSFEGGVYGWTWSTAPTTTEEYIASEVGQGLMGHFIWAAEGYRTLTQTMSVPANANITITFKTKMTDGTGWVAPFLSGGGITGNNGYERANVGGGWILVTHTARTSASGTLTYGAHFVNCIEAYIDELSIGFDTVGVPNQAKYGSLELSEKTMLQLTAAPTTGTWKVGDKVFNSAPATGESFGWVCTVAGSPGTWVPVEVLSAVSADNGDAAATLTYLSSVPTQVWNTPLTVDRAVTLSTTGAINGAKFHIVRTAAATGAFNLNVGTGPLKALATAGTWCDVEYDGSAWILTAYGAL